MQMWVYAVLHHFKDEMPELRRTSLVPPGK
uniref:Uncharacterized protein n=1 Tax=Podoviridae sp. ctZ5d16 TaxID=2825257 RepID=A0A8S5QAH4_9CAUD|nr:MAG TPA: hypothetical protein [Podoviridae sp. ctZ5d16]